MSLSDYIIDGVTYTQVKNSKNDCEGCIAATSEKLCASLNKSCSYNIWVIKGGNTVQDYIAVIDKKYGSNNGGSITESQVTEYFNGLHKKYIEEDVETPKYKHYFKDVSNLDKIDIYRVLELWEVNHPCLQHAAKKILVAGNRGHKDIEKDIQEAIDSLERYKEMLIENNKEKE